MSDAERTEEPTLKRRQEAFKKGQFARAAEISVVSILFSAFCILAYSAQEKSIKIAQFAIGIFSNLNTIELTQNSSIDLLHNYFIDNIYNVFPILSICFLGAIVGGGVQSGFKLTLDALSTKWDRINPISGFQRLFSSSLLITLGIESLKFITVGLILYFTFKKILSHPLFFSQVPIEKLISFMFDSFLSILSKLIGALTLIAIMSYLYQWFKTTKDLRMTKQEVKDEHKQVMGNPQLKSARRRMALQFLQKQLMSSIPTADVIITNPTHYAIAMKYEQGRDKAPIVLAKGKNLLAQKIKKIAKEHEVPLVENKIVARLLYKVGKVGNPIPVELYRVIAEILSYVYRTHKYYFYRLKSRRQEQEILK